MSERPHVLIITADGMRYDALACHGNAQAVSPRLDAFAAESVHCTRAYCSQPICMPCRASIMTGRYPGAHGVWQNGVALDEATPTLPALLAGAGYTTACYGKCHFTPWLDTLDPDEAGPGNEYNGDGPYYGFQHVRVTDHSRQDRYFDWLTEHHPQHVALARDPHSEKPADATIAWKSALPREATKTHYITDLTIDAIRQRERDQPFLIWSSIIDPHHPYNPPLPYCDMFDDVNFPQPACNDGPGPDLPRSYHDWKQRLAEHWGHTDTAQRDWLRIRRMYQGKVAHVDWQIGRIFDTLRDEGLWDDTIVLFLSDHGTMLGDYGLVQVGEYSQEPLVHVPMMWKAPAGDAHQTDALVSVVDILPTLLDYAAVDVPPGVQGLSLRPVLESGETIRDHLIIEQRWGEQPTEEFTTLVTDRHKFSVYSNGVEGELYDLRDDPLEQRNLFNDPAAAALQNELMHRFAAAQLRCMDPLPLRTGCW